jgi:hypothetical protein
MDTLERTDTTLLEALWERDLICEIEHKEIMAMTGLMLPDCATTASAEAVDCQGRFFVCRPLGEYLAQATDKRVTCPSHHRRCLNLRWL